VWPTLRVKGSGHGLRVQTSLRETGAANYQRQRHVQSRHLLSGTPTFFERDKVPRLVADRGDRRLRRFDRQRHHRALFDGRYIPTPFRLKNSWTISSGGRAATVTAAGGAAGAAAGGAAGLLSPGCAVAGAAKLFRGRVGCVPVLGTHIHVLTALEEISSFSATVVAHLLTRSLTSMYMASGALYESVKTTEAMGFSVGRCTATASERIASALQAFRPVDRRSCSQWGSIQDLSA